MTRTALITGGAGDIGGAIARRFLDAGGKVVLVDRSQDGLDRAAERLEADASHLLLIVADVSDEGDARRYAREAESFLGGIDAFFNNAGIEGDAAPIVDYSFERFTQVLAVNVHGVFLGLKYVLPGMLERGSGAVVNSASISGVRGADNLSGYVASKHAVVGLTRTAALEVASRGVRVNAICPSGVEGRMISSIAQMSADLTTTASHPDYAQRNPMKRLARVDEVADLAVFLSSDAASFINGAAYVIDGGRSVQ
jgi:NAD(P)-dependent dehydrogenase (short-subunit alcohol dehydrogenase family)